MLCQGRNKNGERCHRWTKNKFCWQHKPKIIIYTLPTCPYCIKAKLFLDQKNIPYTEIIVNNQIKKQLIKKNGQKTVPQIFINDQFIGGYNDLRQKIK